jgi:hypothetical protein
MSDTPNADPEIGTGTGLADAADAIVDLLAGNGIEAFDEPKQKSESPSDGDGEAEDEPQETPEDDEQRELSDDEEQEGDEQAADEDEEQEEQPSQVPEKFTVKVDGKDVQVDRDELVKGYLRQSDYTRKTTELADQRRVIEGELQEVGKERGQYAILLEKLEDQLKMLQPQEPNWDELYEADPIQAARAERQWRSMKDHMAAIQSEKERVQAAQQGEQVKALRKTVAENQRQLVEKLPEAGDPKKWPALKASIKSHAKELGFSDDEIAQAYDHRALIAIHESRLYRELMAKKPVPVVRKGPKPLQPGSPNRNLGDRFQNANKRLRQTGSVADGANAIMALGLLD